VLTLAGGEVVQGELRDGGGELAIDWTTIDMWAGALWSAGGRGPGACERARDAVLALPGTGFGALRDALDAASR